MAHITLQQLTTVLERIVSWATTKFAVKNTDSGKLDYADMPVVVLASMGHELDGTDTDIPVSVGGTFFLPAGTGTTARIMYRPNSGNPVKISDPVSGVIYCNAYTNLLYRWDTVQAKMVSVGGTSGSSTDVSGKADLLAGTNMLTPSQWPKTVLRNVTDSQLDDLASDDVYFDSGHLYLYKGENQNPVDLNTPSSKIIYFCLADGKMYRWVSNSFQPVLSAVATSGSYNDLSNKPTIPTKISDLTDDSGFLDDEAVDNAIDTALVNYYDKSTINSTFATKLQVEQDLERKQDTLTFDDVPTAGHTTQVMSSDKIKTALDNLLTNLRIVNNEWYIGNTPTGVSAQGPAGNVNITNASQLVTILVNDLTTGGAGNILSAEMGKVLKTAISTLIDSMGNYCFPLGRPTLSWEGAKADIISNFNSHVTSTNTAQRVDIGASFETTLGTDDNLYVIDDDSVVVKMGGVVQPTAYTAATGKVTIGEVTDVIEITANAITYVQTNLVLHLDCMNRGGVSGHWKSLVNNGQSPIDFTLGSGVTAADTGVVFDGGSNSYGETTDGLEIAYNSATIEGVFDGATQSYNPILINPSQGKVGLMIMGTTNKRATIFMGTTTVDTNNQSFNSAFVGSSTTAFAMSLNSSNYVNMGVSTATTDKYQFVLNSAHTKLTIGRARRSEDFAYAGTMKAIRVYNAVLTEQQQLQNWKVDQKRFNIS